jgi:hypothetical protein
MNVNFKWSVGDFVNIPCLGHIVKTEIIERKFIENKEERTVVYVTDLTVEGLEFTQEEIEKHNN